MAKKFVHRTTYFQGGINNFSDPTKISADEMSDSENAISTPFGTRAKRRGCVKYNATGTGADIKRIFDYWRGANDNTLIVAYEANIDTGASGSLSNIKTGLDTDAYPDFAVVDGVLYIANGVNFNMAYDGSNLRKMGIRRGVTLRTGFNCTGGAAFAGGVLPYATLDASASGTDDFYTGAIITIRDDVRLIVEYNGTSKKASVDSDFTAVPTANESYEIDQVFVAELYVPISVDDNKLTITGTTTNKILFDTDHPYHTTGFKIGMRITVSGTVNNDTGDAGKPTYYTIKDIDVDAGDKWLITEEALTTENITAAACTVAEAFTNALPNVEFGYLFSFYNKAGQVESDMNTYRRLDTNAGVPQVNPQTTDMAAATKQMRLKWFPRGKEAATDFEKPCDPQVTHYSIYRTEGDTAGTYYSLDDLPKPANGLIASNASTNATAIVLAATDIGLGINYVGGIITLDNGTNARESYTIDGYCESSNTVYLSNQFAGGDKLLSNYTTANGAYSIYPVYYDDTLDASLGAEKDISIERTPFPVVSSLTGAKNRVFGAEADHSYAGTVVIPKGSRSVAGTNTVFSQAMVGCEFTIGASYIIESVESTTKLTLKREYEETDASGASYLIRQTLSTLFYSDIDSDGVILPEVNRANDWISAGVDDGRTIVGFAPIAGDDLAVFKRTHLYALTGNTRELFSVKRIIAGVGTFNSRTPVNIGGVLVWPSDTGADIADISGEQLDLAAKVPELFSCDVLDISRNPYAVAAYHGPTSMLWIGQTLSGSSYNDVVNVYNTKLKAWGKFTGLDVNAIAIVTNSSGELKIYTGDTIGFVYEQDKATVYNDGAGSDADKTRFGCASASAGTTITQDNALNGYLAFYTNGDDLTGCWVEIISGTSIGERRRIASNTATVITVSAAWTANPPVGSVFHIGGIKYYDEPGGWWDGSREGISPNELKEYDSLHIVCEPQSADYTTGTVYGIGDTGSNIIVTGLGTAWSASDNARPGHNFYVEGDDAEYFVKSSPTKINTAITVAFEHSSTNPDRITKAFHDFAAEGLLAGMYVTFSGTANNNKTYLVATIAVGAVIFDASEVVTNESAVSATFICDHLLLTASTYTGLSGVRNASYSIGAKLLYADIYGNWDDSTSIKTVFANMAYARLKMPLVWSGYAIKVGLRNNRVDEYVEIKSFEILGTATGVVREQQGA